MSKPYWKWLLAYCIVVCFSRSALGETPERCRTVGPQNILVVLADFQGALTPLPNVNYLQELFRAPASEPSIAGYLKLVSSNLATVDKLRFVGPYHLAHTVTHDPQSSASVQSTLEKLKHEVVDLAAREVDLNLYERLVIFTPSPLDAHSGTEYQTGAGSGSNFCDFTVATARGRINFAQAWIRADRRFLGFKPQDLSGHWDRLSPRQRTRLAQIRKVSDMQPIMHEIGHTFGLGHANRLARPSVNKRPFFHDEVLPDTDVKLYQIGYGDIFSVMSSSAMGWLSIPHLNSLGWLAKSALAEVRRDGVFRIFPLSAAGPVLRGLKIPRLKSRADNPAAFLWVEYRPDPSAYEMMTPLDQMKTDGPLVYYTNPAQPSPQGWNYPNETLILNFAKSGYVEPAFETDFTLKGEWHDPHSLVGIKTLRVTKEFADVQVSFSH